MTLQEVNSPYFPDKLINLFSFVLVFNLRILFTKGGFGYKSGGGNKGNSVNLWWKFNRE